MSASRLGSLRLLPCGPEALLVELAPPPGAAGAAHPAAVAPAALARAARSWPEVTEAVAAAQTVLLRTRVGGQARLRDRLLSLDAGQQPAPAVPVTPVEALTAARVSIQVAYDGADLALVAEQTGLSTAEVIARHTRPEYVVEFVGFAPGFGYLRGLDPSLHLPRLPSPRIAVPAGSVAIAGPYSAVYPGPSPGGWLLLGRTEEVMFDVTARPPARLQAGTRVRFEPVG